MLAEADSKKIAESINRARMALASDKRADLETAMFDLNGVSQQLSEVMLLEAERGQARGHLGRRRLLMARTQQRDYYEVLGVARERERAGDQERLPASWRSKYHPDRNPGDHEAEERFKEAAEAYAVLSDPDKRARYDRFGHQGVGGAAAGGFDPTIFADFSDILGDLFGFGISGWAAAAGGAARRRRAPICATTSSSRSRRRPSADTAQLEIPRLETCAHLLGQRQRGRQARRRPARPAAGAARCGSARASSPWRAPARSATARDGSSPILARSATAKVGSRRAARSR